ncbi:hypothetical protein ACTQ44_05485 [Ligilactobacillus ruminis]|uniref:hypothetical protein n=1 Tax=Ligilactobacillus ruminis TaxID=1623 RepID=UPI003F947BD1
MKKKLIIGLVVILGLILTGCRNNQAKQDSNKNYATSTSSQSNSPYLNLSKSKAEQVKKADSTVSKVYDAKFQAEKDDEKVDANIINKRPANYVPKIVATAETKATKAIAEIKGNDTNTKDIRQAYTDVVNVAKDSSLINMQTARSHIALLKDSELATHMEKEYETPMATSVAQHTSLDISTILNETKPLSEQKLKAAQEKAAQEKAAASAASSSSERAKESSVAASAATSSAQSTYQAPAQNTAPAQSSTQRSTAPAAKSHYTAPANNTQRYSAPASQAPAPQQHAASNNQAAQKAASSAQVPADAENKGWGLTGANGEPLDWGSW